jgi:hypothetical protein
MMSGLFYFNLIICVCSLSYPRKYRLLFGLVLFHYRLENVHKMLNTFCSTSLWIWSMLNEIVQQKKVDLTRVRIKHEAGLQIEMLELVYLKG